MSTVLATSGATGDPAQALIADIPTPALPVWSPDGQRIAYLWDDGVGWELWEVNSTGGQARRLATDAALSRCAWSPDGAEIVYTRQVVGGTALATLTLTTGVARALTPGPFDRAPRWSPDGGTIIFLSGRAGHVDVWSVHATGGAASRLTERTNPLDEPRWTPSLSPDGRWIAYISSRSGERNNDDLWLVSADGREHRQLTTGLVVSSDPVWSPDGARLAIAAASAIEPWRGDDADLWLVALDDTRPRRVTTGGVAYRNDGGGLAWAAAGAGVYTLTHAHGDTNLAYVRIADGLPTRVTQLHGQITDMALSPAGDRFAIVVSRPTEPPELAVLAVGGGLPALLTSAGARVRSSVVTPIRMPFRSFDGLYCDAHLFLPKGVADGRPLPALAQAHGGGTNAFGNGWRPVEQFLAARGFIVFAVEYRGSSGYGPAFADLSLGDWGGAQTLDVVAAAAFLRSQNYVANVGIYGGSYGGYLTLHALVAAPDAFAAAADLYGITNRFDYFERSDRVGRLFVTRGYGGRGPRDAPDAYLRASTHHRLEAIRTPLLVLHGAEDARVPPIQSEAVVAALRAHGVEHEYRVYPGEGHGFRLREHRIDAYERVARWFAQHLAPRADAKNGAS